MLNQALIAVDSLKDISTVFTMLPGRDIYLNHCFISCYLL